ncbi:FUSC family protein [Amycolatopsis sp. NBC_01480]|uniref:FUSC family protein n=1 Tax=Amycolatopsis sp. NBC_01480 TaxID=2903562 RepID=UPI002E2CB9ED|nr:FUSC family protein [Amycolatopsis sp. NBC_01480]
MSWWHDRTPAGWLARAVRVRGQERHTLIQAAKAALAATAAWLIATRALQLTQPFLAPYAAVFLVETTVYRSLRSWAQQVGSVTAGVLLAWVAARLVPWPTVTLAVVVFAGLLAGSWRRFGSSGVWVGVTGLLVVSYGTEQNLDLLGDRLLETALGAAVGLAVNALVFPPLHGDRLAAAADRLGQALAGLLETTAELVRRDEPPEDVDEWLAEARDVRSLVGAARDALGLTREGRYLNLRSRGPWAGWDRERPLEKLIGLWLPAEQLVAAIRGVTEGREPFGYPWSDARRVVADLFDRFADAVRSTADPASAVDLDSCRELLEQVEKRLVASDDGVTATLGLGAMALPARHLLQQLEQR